mmetsp:Transcript_3955/g.9651  ORF Transcript_3955/g.9651 Transcript_3955/m.9651 type:complete len:248 (+) Transcript_3955:686-1429(+)
MPGSVQAVRARSTKVVTSRTATHKGRNQRPSEERHKSGPHTERNATDERKIHPEAQTLYGRSSSGPVMQAPLQKNRERGPSVCHTSFSRRVDVGRRGEGDDDDEDDDGGDDRGMRCVLGSCGISEGSPSWPAWSFASYSLLPSGGGPTCTPKFEIEVEPEPEPQTSSSGRSCPCAAPDIATEEGWIRASTNFLPKILFFRYMFAERRTRPGNSIAERRSTKVSCHTHKPTVRYGCYSASSISRHATA